MHFYSKRILIKKYFIEKKEKSLTVYNPIQNIDIVIDGFSSSDFQRLDIHSTDEIFLRYTSVEYQIYRSIKSKEKHTVVLLLPEKSVHDSIEILFSFLMLRMGEEKKTLAVATRGIHIYFFIQMTHAGKEEKKSFYVVGGIYFSISTNDKSTVKLPN